MSCDETKRLAADEASITKFSDAVSKLRKKIGVSARDMYQQLDRAANEARPTTRTYETPTVREGCVGRGP